MGMLNSGQRRGTPELLQLYNSSMILRQVVGKISLQVASTEWKVYRQGKGKRVRSDTEWRNCMHAPQRVRRQIIRSLRKAQDLVEVVEHPFHVLMRKPNPFMHGFQLIALIQTWMDIKDEAFVVKEFDAAGNIIALWPVPPSWVSQVPDGERTTTFKIAFGSWRETLDPDHVMWLKTPNPVNPYGRPEGCGDALADEFDTEEAAAAYTKAFFRNFAKPSAIIGVKNATSPDQLNAAQEHYDNLNRGNRAHGRVHFTSGELTVHELGEGFKDAKVTDLRSSLHGFVRQTYGVSPEVFGQLESSNRATVTEAMRFFVSTVIRPRCELLRVMLQEQLLPDFDDRSLLDYESALPEDRELRLEMLKDAPWVATVNEWRAVGEWPEIENGNVFMMPATLTPIDADSDLTEFAPPAPMALPAPAAAKPKEEPAKAIVVSIHANDPHAIAAAAHAAVQRMGVDIESAIAALRADRITNEVDPLWEEEVGAWMIDAGESVGFSASMQQLNPFIKDHIEELELDRIKGLVDETTKEQLRAQMAEGVQNGESSEDIAKRVEAVFDEADRSRARAIARTEVGRSANFANRTAWQLSGVVEEREWVATADDKTRDSHAALDGETKPLNEPWVIGAATADHPGDFGEPEEDINCRCAEAAVVSDPTITDDEVDALLDDEKAVSLSRGALLRLSKAYKRMTKDQRAGYWRALQHQLTPWENKATRAFKRGFAHQREDVLAVIRKR